MKYWMLSFFLILAGNCLSQSNIANFISHLDSLRILRSDTIKMPARCYEYEYTLKKDLSLNYDTLKCNGILWCCDKVCEIEFYKIIEYSYKWTNVSDNSTLLYKREKRKIVNNYYYIASWQMQKNKTFMKQEYIIRTFREEPVAK